MKNIKDELQHIILGHDPVGQTNQLKKTQRFLRSNAETGFATENQQRLKSEETAILIAFAKQEGIIYAPTIRESDFISAGAEQKFIELMGRMSSRPMRVSFTSIGSITSTAC